MLNDSHNLVGKAVGTYFIEKIIGQGGMGTVYLARQTRPSRHVAIKVLFSNPGYTSRENAEYLARFRQEADVIARLEHVNIIPIYDYGEQEGAAYLVMPYLPGGSLRDRLAHQGTLSLRETANYLDQIASALEYAHIRGVVHRDLKPANLLIHTDGRLALSDFGIARLMEKNDTHGVTLTATGMLLGTPEYMAPEMFLGEPIDFQVDIYAMGVTLFQMLTGQVPFKGTTPFAVATKHLQEVPPLVSQLKPSLPSGINEVVQKALAKKRENRYATAKQLAQAFRAIITEPSTQTVVDMRNAPTISPSTQLALSPLQERGTSAQFDQAISNPITVPSSGFRHRMQAVERDTSYPQRPRQLATQQPWLVLISILLAFILVVGGIFIGIQFTKGSNNPGSATGKNSATETAGITSTQTTANPTSASTPSSLSFGPLLYNANLPGPSCDTGGGNWINFDQAAIICQQAGTQVGNTQQSAQLAGFFLINIPGHSYPGNYIVEAKLQQANTSHADFGIYFRNQPGNQQGVYTFLIHPNGTWSAYVYDNTTGAPTEIGAGVFGNAYSSVIVDVVVTDAKFTFYANKQYLGSAYDASYSTGTAGIAVDQGGLILVSDFALYATTS